MRNRWCCPCCWLPASETARTNGGYSSVLPYTVWGSNLFQMFCNMFSESSPFLLGQHVRCSMHSPTTCGTLRKHNTKPSGPSCRPRLYVSIPQSRSQTVTNCHRSLRWQLITFILSLMLGCLLKQPKSPLPPLPLSRSSSSTISTSSLSLVSVLAMILGFGLGSGCCC